MDPLIACFAADKKKFLDEIESKNFMINSLVIGMTLGITNKELTHTPVYLRLLQRIIVESSSDLEYSYCFLKFYKTCYEILQTGRKSRGFITIYLDVSMVLSEKPVHSSLIKNVASFFSSNFLVLAKYYCGSVQDFFEIYVLGSRNMGMFIGEVPLILDSQISENINRVYLSIESNYNEFLIGYKKIGQVLMSCSSPEKTYIVEFMFALTSYLIKNKNTEFIQFIQNSIHVLKKFLMPRHIEEIIKSLHGSNSDTKISQNPEEKNIQNTEKKNESILNSSRLNNSKEFSFTEQCSEVREQYSGVKEQYSVEKEMKTESQRSMLGFYLEEMLSSFNFNKKINEESILEDFLGYHLDISLVAPFLYGEISDFITKNKKEENIPLWILLINSFKKYFTEEQISELNDLVSRISQSPEFKSRSNAYSRRRPPFRRSQQPPRSSQNDTESMLFKPPDNIEEFVPESYQHLPKEPSVSFKDYFEILSSQFAGLFKDYAEKRDLSEITAILIEIKSRIKQNSPSASVSMIGSALFEALTDDFHIDVLVVDFLSANPRDLIAVSLRNLENGVFEEDLMAFYSSTKYVFSFTVNSELHLYNSYLIRQYILNDSRFKELIIAYKILAKKHLVYGSGFPSGFQVCLLLLVFLQTAEPPILPKLQNCSHVPQVISGCDVFYSTDLVFRSENTKNIGELFYSFLQFLLNLTNGFYLPDPCSGEIHEVQHDQLLPVLSPFDHKIVSSSLKTSEKALRFVQILDKTLKNIENRSSILISIN